MKFRPPEKVTRRVRATLDMTPLIDVVFQLVLFFMLSATFVVQSSINIEMPKAQGAAALEQKDLTITLAKGPGGFDGRGAIYVGAEEVGSMEELSQVIRARAGEQPDLMLLIRADGRSQVDRLTEILGVARVVGITRFGIAAEPAEAQE